MRSWPGQTRPGKRVASTEERLARLEAKDAIRELKARYAQACDAGFDLDALRQLFAPEAVFDAGEFGRFDGRDAILAYYATVPDAISWGLHYIAGPTITVSDDLQTAEGTWYFLQPATMADRAVWIMGTYRDAYRRDDDEWRFARIELTVETVTPFEAGWVEHRFLGALDADAGAD